MPMTDTRLRLTGLAFGSAMASVLLAGCATTVPQSADAAATAAQTAMAEGRHDRALRLAEQAVEADPHNAATRALLGKAYLDAGRFASAETTFTDAMMLGDNSPRTALSLALALTAQAKYTEAGALLNAWEGRLPVADLGLALALAGQPDRGIHLMTNAIRGGDDTVKMRQNLAYAYAVAGRWRESRLMASQDVPADQVGARMEQWAAMAAPEAYEQRVARLLGVPAGVRDAGQPLHLALSNTPTPQQLGAEATALAAAQAPADPLPTLAAVPQPPAPLAMAVPANGQELPAVGSASLTELAPVSAMAPVSVPEAPRMAANTRFAQAFSGETQSQTAIPALDASSFSVAERATSTAAPAARPAAPVTNRYAAATQPRESVQAGAPAAPATRRAASDGSHLVQLGSFSSEQGARRAWGIYVSRHPQLANHEMVITEAVVNGRRYFRVSAGGFDRSASRAMCGQINARSSDGCISWAAASPLPGAVDRGIRMASR
ncbi:tetratricopeptide repeat protein [Altererythrobacter lauratis]